MIILKVGNYRCSANNGHGSDCIGMSEKCHLRKTYDSLYLSRHYVS
jgi:hypothetical protein